MLTGSSLEMFKQVKDKYCKKTERFTILLMEFPLDKPAKYLSNVENVQVFIAFLAFMAILFIPS